MQEGVWQRAHEAFTRSAQIDPSSGEAWNNAAAVALRLQWNSAAYEALKEATKLMPFDWRTHENAATAALRLGYLQKASNSLQSAFRASGKDHLDENGVEAVVSRLITQYQNYEGEKRVREDHDASTKREDLTKAATGEDKDALAAAFDALAERGVVDDDEEDDGPSIDRAGAQEEEKEEKCDMDAVEISRTAQIIETLLSEAAEESRCNTRMWGCFAQLKELRGKLNEARDCRAKQVKQLHGSSSLQDSEKALIEYMHAVTHLCELHSQLGEAERSSSVARSAKAAVPNSFEQTEAATKLVKLAERFAG
jgi:tetratricopeptide (TPR) repeat protein